VTASTPCGACRVELKRTLDMLACQAVRIELKSLQHTARLAVK
jgi:hypothetical protein